MIKFDILSRMAACLVSHQIIKQFTAMHDGNENMAMQRSTGQSYAICGDILAKIDMVCHFYAPD